MRRKSLIFCLLLLAGFQSRAEDSQTSKESVKIKDVAPEAVMQPGEDVDEIITNKKMRAESGSKSKLSISNTLTYNGGSIEKPLAEMRPNITGAAGTTAVAYLSDKLAGKFNISQTKSLLAGVGLRWITPLYGSSKPSDPKSGKPYDGQKIDADNPYINYQYVYKWAGIQSVLYTGPTLWTDADQRQAGFQYEYDVTQNNVYEIGKSGVGVGLLLTAGAISFDKTADADGHDLRPYQNDYYGGAYPFLEYQLNDHLNLRTITGLAVYEHRRSLAAGTYVKNKVYQSIGVGISVTRDVFLYPNVQFLPDNMRADTTNVALSANVNVF